MLNGLPGVLLLMVLSDVQDLPSDRVPHVTVSPTYPAKAVRERIEGDVMVCFRIDVHGRIRGARIEYSSHRLFHKPALKAIRRSSFEPAGPGQPPETRTCRTFRFRLEPLDETP